MVLRLIWRLTLSAHRVLPIGPQKRDDYPRLHYFRYTYMGKRVEPLVPNNCFVFFFLIPINPLM